MRDKKLTLNVYDENGNVKKTCEAQLFSIKFRTIRSLMKLLKVEDIDNTWSLLKVINEAWEEITFILGQCFPDMEEDDWDNVELNELIPVVVIMIKESFMQMTRIPTDSKNQ